MAIIDYSLILPIKNEAASLNILLTEIKRAMRWKSYEIIAVDDVSTDETSVILKRLQQKIPQVKIISFTTHQGKWGALVAGLRKACGKVIITLDADLQDDPADIGKLINTLNRGYDFVSGWRKKRQDIFFKVWLSCLGNHMVSSFGLGRFHDLNSSLKVYRGEAIDSLPQSGSLLRFSLLFAQKMGYRTKEIPVNHRPRLYGRSKFGIVKYLRIIFDLLLIFLLFSGSGRLTRFNKLKKNK